jgi:TolB-like protein/DNA-binding winged helix-turn-helix (wHTH) protein
MQSRQVCTFGPFQLDAGERQLLREGKPVPLTPKCFDLLLVLVENSGHLVEKNEILERLWPDQFVEEGNLSFNISVLRKALGEIDSKRSYIETVPKKGFRFVGLVKRVFPEESVGRAGSDIELEDSEPPFDSAKSGEPSVETTDPPIPSMAVPQSTRNRVAIIAVLAAATVIAASYFVLRNRSNAAVTPFKTVAVLPFKPILASTRDESLELGMAETLITSLAGIKQLVVRPMSSVRKYADLQQDSSQAGRELQVDAVLDGSIQKDGDRVRVAVRLIDTHNGALLWAEQFDENFTDIFKVQDSISRRVTNALKLKLSGDEQAQLTKRYTNDPEAYELYLQGHYLWTKRDLDSLIKSLEYYQRAVDKDPKFAMAYVGIAESNMSKLGSSRVSAQETIPRAIAATTKALELDPSLAEAHNSLAELKYQYEYDWTGAEKEFILALKLNPNAAFIHLGYGWFLMQAGRFDEAHGELERAQVLDPGSTIINRARGRLLYFRRQFDQAIPHYQKIIELEPNVGQNHWAIAQVYAQKEMYAEAVDEFLKAVRPANELRPGQAERIEAARALLRASGWQGFQEKTTAFMEERSKTVYVAPHKIAMGYARQGKIEQSFNWLEKAVEQRDPAVVTVKVEPVFDGLRGHPRYAKLLQSLNLSP